MKTVILAAVAAGMSLCAPAFAQDDYGGNMQDQNGMHIQRDRRDYRDDRYYGGYHRHHMHECRTEVTHEWRHNHMVTRKVTICNDHPHEGD